MMMRPVEAGQRPVFGPVTDRVAVRALGLPAEHIVERSGVKDVVGPGFEVVRGSMLQPLDDLRGQKPEPAL